jgi:hypothetical protein
MFIVIHQKRKNKTEIERFFCGKEMLSEIRRKKALIFYFFFQIVDEDCDDGDFLAGNINFF